MRPSFCSDCGAALHAGSAFCTGCGRPVATGATPYDRRPAPRRRSRTGWTVAIAVSILLVPVAVLGVVGYLVWQDQRASAEQMRREELIDFVEVDETAPPADSETYDMFEVSATPVPLDEAGFKAELSRQYPPLLRDAGVSGRVELKMLIRADGTVDPDRVEVLEASHPGFAAPAERVAARMRFRPGQVGDLPVATWVILPILFQVE